MTDWPAPLLVSEPGSFAEYTIVQRKPEILAAVLASNAYPGEIVQALQALGEELGAGPVQPLSEAAPDVAFWNRAWHSWRGLPWTQLSWYWAETYFYRRVLEATRYFQVGPWAGVDPFEPQKREGLDKALSTLVNLYAAAPPPTAAREEQFLFWLLRSLWGNRADLSNLPTAARSEAGLLHGRAALLIDHSEALWCLLADGLRRIAWICDNCGLELLCDLALVDWLLSARRVEQIQLHVKGQPFFVSDTMPKDVELALDTLAASSQPLLCSLAVRLRAARAQGRLAVHTHPFWTSYLSFWHWPYALARELGQADLLVLKGDVNYRRLLDDRHWPHDTDLAAVAHYVPTSLVALRTLKGELMVGLAPGQAEALHRQDAEWLINGERGLIHLLPRRSEAYSTDCGKH